MRWLGPVLVVGGAALGAAWYLRPNAWDAPVAGLRTRFTGGDSTTTQGGPNVGPSRAQLLQDLRVDEASIDEALKRARDELQQLTRQTVSGEDAPREVAEDGCGVWNRFLCVMQNMAEWAEEQERELERQRNAARARVRELERDLEVVRAEIDSVVLTR